MNKVFLIGRLTRDPELRYTSSNLANMRCSIAVDRTYQREGEERGTDFINIVAFGNRAETMKKYLTKGSRPVSDEDSSSDVTPYDFSNGDATSSSDDPFADFGAKIEVSDSELPF